MPIIRKDPWRQQYFDGISCPEHIVVPLKDDVAYALFPEHHWIYNKLLICETQGLAAAPHGIAPKHFPVFSKPAYNLRSMGAESLGVSDADEYQRCYRPGHMWMELLEGEHVSSDVALVNGVPQWWRHTLGAPSGQGTFDHWHVLANSRPALENYGGAWLSTHLRGYTGMANLETIGGRIIEAHLRFADQWPDLYGAGWMDAVVRLYAEGTWDFADHARSDGFSVVLFGPHSRRYAHPPASLVECVKALPGISSVQITFDAEKPPEQHSMPPGGFRLAVINSRSLDEGYAARRLLADYFAEAPACAFKNSETA